MRRNKLGASFTLIEHNGATTGQQFRQKVADYYMRYGADGELVIDVI